MASRKRVEAATRNEPTYRAKIAFLGAGNMGAALIGGVLRSGMVRPTDVVASDVSAERLAAVKKMYGIVTMSSNVEAVRRAATVVLAVKPQVMIDLLAEIRGAIGANRLIVSIAAGIPIATLQAGLGRDARIIRAIPNTPAQIGIGVTALARGAAASAEDAETAKRLFNAVGTTVEVREAMLDAVTGLSGSGPGYVFLFIEALADGGVKMGLPRDVALKLAAQTVAGAGQMAAASGEHPAALRDRVASPGGTTMAGLHELERGKVRAAIMSAVEVAARRSAELGAQRGKPRG